jgi:DeoR/GlpR family transcriptional regulator of sugar metabolism
MNSRQNSILGILTTNKKANVNYLAKELNVSTVTIRQDLSYLEAEGYLTRVHGGAILKSADDISYRLAINYDKKIRIAKAAAECILDGDTIFLESGSINALLARELEERKNINIITTNVFIVRQLRRNKTANIILLGGIYQTESESLVGNLAKQFIEKVNFNKCFIGIDGFETNSGFTSKDILRADIASSIIKKSPEVYIVSDSSKFGLTQLTSICNVNDVDYVITDSDIEDKYRSFLEAGGVKVIIA